MGFRSYTDRVSDLAGPMFSTFRIDAISAADIIFVYDGSTRVRNKVIRFINVVGQRILASIRKAERLTLALRVRKYSHVMLGVGGGLIIHADGKTVAVELISVALHCQTTEESLFQVYRRKDLSHDQADQIVKSAMRYYNQKYRFTTYFGESDAGDTTQFCSRLVAHAYCAAGVRLTSLAENRVLPVDLYQICQSDKWIDVSDTVVQEAPSTDIDELLPSIEIPGQGELSISDFLAHCDEVTVKTAQLRKQMFALQYDTTRKLLENEALLAQFVSSQFGLSKQLRVMPSAIDDKDAFRITRVLEQLGAVLALSKLPSIELLVANTFLNTIDNQTNVSLYAGYPTPTAIREMQHGRVSLSIYDYLLLAEVGLLTILAHRTPHEKFERFRSVRSEFADRFVAALPPFDDFEPYEKGEDLFVWIERESDRATCREVLGHILLSLRVIALLRSSGAKSDKSG